MPKLKPLHALLLCLLIYGCSYKSGLRKAENQTVSVSKIDKENKTDLPKEREEWEYNRVKNPLTGEVPTENLLKVYNDYLKRSEDDAMRVVIPGVEWRERGPNNIGGRTRAMIFDKNDNTNKTVFAAAIGGGLFKCSDIDATTPSWTKVDDFFSNIGISCIVQKQAHPDTIYFGTGEGFGNSDAQRGSGVWRSANGGSSFTQLGSSMGGSVPTYINRLAIATNGTVYAATSSGLYRSTNGGTSWSAFLTTGTSPSSASNNGKDVKVAANGTIYYSCQGQVWRYASSTWTNITPSGTFFRIEIASAPSDGTTLYLLCQTSGNPAFYYSNNSGTGWTSRSCPLIYDQAATATTEFTRTQSWYDLSIAVHPDTATTVYVGGIDYVKSKDAGATYRQISAWSLYLMPGAALLSTNQVMHSDHHQLIFKPGTPTFALFANDGGIYKSSNFNVASPTYTAINTDYNVTQYYSCAIANTAYSNNFIAGAQDNGTHKFTSGGINSVTEVSGGDGAYSFIDQTNSNKQISSYVYNNYYKSTDATNFSTLTRSNNTGDFINPGDLDGVNGILYSKADTTGADRIARWTTVFGSVTRTNITLTSIDISHIKVSPNTPTTIYLGTTDGKVYRITGANSGSSYSPTLIGTGFGGRISSIDIRKAASDDTILITQSSYGLGNSVLVTRNGTAGSPTWTDLDDNSTLPDIPINWGLMSPTYSRKVVLATEMGIYTCNDIYASPAVWGQSVSGLANVRVDMLKMRMADSLVLAATHGRGLYTCDIFTTVKADFVADKTLVYVGESIQFTDDSYKATSYAWDFNNDGVTDATSQNPTYAFGTGGFKTIKLTINGSTLKTRTDYIQVLPNMSTPYDTAAGGSFDRYSKAFHFGSKAILGTTNLWERGIPSNVFTANSSPNAWETDLDADIVSGTYQCALFSPNFNFTSAGTYTISFRKSMEVAFCNAPMAVQVQYSTDKGVSWTRLGVNGSGTNWYNRYPAAACPVDAAVFSDQYGWTNNYAKSSTSYDVSFLAGNANVAFRIVMSVVSGYSGSGYTVDGFMVDDFTISGPANTASADIETAVSEQTQPLGASATVDYYSPNGKYLATLKNNTSFNFGNTKVEIDNAGIGTSNFSTNVLSSKRVLKKTIKVTPTNANSSSVDITMYFAKTEVDSFVATTGNAYTTLNLIKTAGSLLSTGTIANTTYGSSTVVATHLDGKKVTATFSNGFSGLGAGANGAGGPLPVTWLSFTGTREVNDVTLTWKTASEINNSHFEIERMIDGEKEFTNVGRQTGNGTVNQISTYTYKDLLPVSAMGKTVYYRLKQVDFNGQSDYSRIIALHHKNNLPGISIYPNPGNKILNIDLGTSEHENLSVRVFNQNGAKVFESKLGNSLNSFNMEKYSSGLYLITIYSNDIPVLNEKWIKE